MIFRFKILPYSLSARKSLQNHPGMLRWVCSDWHQEQSQTATDHPPYAQLKFTSGAHISPNSLLKTLQYSSRSKANGSSPSSNTEGCCIP